MLLFQCLCPAVVCFREPLFYGSYRLFIIDCHICKSIDVGKHGVEQIPCFYVVCSTHAISISGIIIAGILYTVDNIGTFPPVYARCPQSITAIGTLNYACKNIFKSSRIFFPPAARHKPLDSIKFLLRDYPLMSIGYHFPFFGQLRKAFPAFHAGGNPFVACKVSRIYRT